MELKKWMAVFVVGAEVVAGLMIGGAGPATVPAATPAASVTPADNSNNSGGSRRDRSGRRGRSNNNNRDSSSPAMLVADPFAVVKTRSIFVKGNQAIAGDAPRQNSDNGPRAFFAGSQASSLIFNGVILVNNEPQALIEDSGSGNVVQVRAGDPISGGKVSEITLGDLTYAVGGKTKHVSIGETLEGQVPASSSYGAGPTTNPTSMPSGGMPAVPAKGGGGGAPPPGTSTSNLSPDDILARLKARRAAESGGK